MAQFRKKPVEVEARELTEDNVDDIVAWVKANGGQAAKGLWKVGIRTLEGIMHASIGDWIVKGVQDEFWPVKPDIFEATYEPVEDSAGG